MLVLAQLVEITAATQPASRAAPAFHFDPDLWVPTFRGTLAGASTFLTILAVGVVAWLVLRRFLTRHRLGPAFWTAAVALALYFCFAAIVIDRWKDPYDSLAWWLHRLFAAAMLFAGLRLVDRLVIVPLLSRGGRVQVQRFIHQLANIVLVLFAVLGFGSAAFGWDIDKFLAGSAVVSIVLGLALQETLGNFFSGMVMQASSPFAPGDWIRVGDTEGKVVDMSWRAVTVHTSQDNYVHIPNGEVAKAQIINYNAPSRATAREVRVGLEYETTPADAVECLTQAALDAAGVLRDPPPQVYLEDYADFAIVYRVKFWIDEPAGHERVEHRVRMHAWYRLKQRGFDIPFPIHTIETVDWFEKHRREQEAARDARRKAIASLPLLSPLTTDQRQTVADAAGDVLLGQGSVLFRQGDAGDTFYVVRAGQVEVLVRGDGAAQDVRVAVLGAGEFFGEMGALTGQPRTATIRAATDVALVEIEKRDLQLVVDADPSVLEKLSEVIAQRNADRNAKTAARSQASIDEYVQTEKRTLLQRMAAFFGRGGGRRGPSLVP